MCTLLEIGQGIMVLFLLGLAAVIVILLMDAVMRK